MNNLKELVKQLRAMTGAGILDCSNALKQTEGDIQAAIAILKTLGMAKFEKKANNEVNASILLIKENDEAMVAIVFSAETDFSLKTDVFCKFANDEADYALNNLIEDLAKDSQFDERKKMMAAELGENIVLTKFQLFKKSSENILTSYLHNFLNENFKNIAEAGVILRTNREISQKDAKNLCIHIVGNKHAVLNQEDLTEEVILKYGYLKDKNNDLVLLNQKYFFDDGINVKEFLKKNNITLLECNLYSKDFNFNV